MSHHATAEVLSAYLDAELEAGEARDLSRHLEDCDDCRARLDSLRRVVTSVRRLERAAPPPVLAQYVQQRINLAGRPRGLVERLESQMRDVPQLPSIFVTFALVFALALIVYVFVVGVHRHLNPTEIVLLPVPRPPAPTGEVLETREAAGRTFDLVDGIWREQGVTEPVADLRIEADSAAGRALLDLYPGLSDLGGRIFLRLPEGIIELRLPPPEPPAEPEEGGTPTP